MKHTDTIVAIATPRGNAALAIIRLSGSETFAIISHIIKHSTLNTAPSKLHRATFYDADTKLDEGMLCLFKSPHSFTGEDMAELYCHGNDFIVSQVLEAILRHCRLAEPGEFTQRAFLNKKIDLTQAEAVGNLLNARTKKAQQAALLQMGGRLYKNIKGILDQLTALRIVFELAIDFIEDEVPQYTPENINKMIDDALQDIKSLIDTAQDGIIVQNGIRVCLTGAPNVGKSSIFNALLETERAIITPIAGTTRDYLEESFSLDGYLVNLVDTAGLHQTDDIVEQFGIERTKTLVDTSDIVLYISSYEIDTKTDETLLSHLPPAKTIKVINKTDLMTTSDIQDRTSKGYLPCSACSETVNIQSIKSHLLSLFQNIDTEIETGIITNTRQLGCVKRAYENLSKAAEALNIDMGIDFIAFDIAEASNALEEIIGKVSTEDILTQIFESFCIGK